MKFYFPFIVVALIFSSQPLQGQNENLVNVLKKVFYEKTIYDKIFFDYHPMGSMLYDLQDGRYTFILPNRIFQKEYPEILDKLSASWATERKSFTLTFIKEPESTVFISNTFLFDQSKKLFVIFEEISISKGGAKLSFYTNSIVGTEELKDKYVRVEAFLKNRKGKWRIKELQIVSKLCCTDIYPDLHKSLER
jgi:hypothetical protein